MDVTVQALRERIEELEEEVRQLHELIRGPDAFSGKLRAALGLGSGDARTLQALMRREVASFDMICHGRTAEMKDNHVTSPQLRARCFISRLRKALLPHGIAIGSVHGVGYFITPEAKAKVRERLGEIPGLPAKTETGPE